MRELISMRTLILSELSYYLDLSDGVGVPLFYDALPHDYAESMSDLEALSDRDLLDCYNATLLMNE